MLVATEREKYVTIAVSQRPMTTFQQSRTGQATTKGKLMYMNYHLKFAFSRDDPKPKQQKYTAK